MTHAHTSLSVELAERQIDASFEKTSLREAGAERAVWVLLCTGEILIHNETQRLRQMPMAAPATYASLLDQLMHVVSVAARFESKPLNSHIGVTPEEYEEALRWIGLARHYRIYNAIFPMARRGYIQLQIDDRGRLSSDFSFEKDAIYSAYCLHWDAQDGRITSQMNSDSDMRIDELLRKVDENTYLTPNGRQCIDYTNDLDLTAKAFVADALSLSHKLPAEWRLSRATIEEFRSFTTTLHSLSMLWQLARFRLHCSTVRFNSLSGGVIVIAREKFLQQISQKSGLSFETCEYFTSLLSQKVPSTDRSDITLRPIIDSGEDLFVAPSVVTTLNFERNLAELIQTIPAERSVYDTCKDSKEPFQKEKLRSQLNKKGVAIRSFKINETDVDIAFVDAEEKACLILELKWLLEPTCTREFVAREKDLKKGVRQCKTLREMIVANNAPLYKGLDVDSSYDIFPALATAGYIGRSVDQDEEVPIVRDIHVVSMINLHGVRRTMEILRARDYLPSAEDLKYSKTNVTVGDWTCNWQTVDFRSDSKWIIK